LKRGLNPLSDVVETVGCIGGVSFAASRPMSFLIAALVGKGADEAGASDFVGEHASGLVVVAAGCDGTHSRPRRVWLPVPIRRLRATP